jgi:hypothetical protein
LIPFILENSTAPSSSQTKSKAAPKEPKASNNPKQDSKGANNDNAGEWPPLLYVNMKTSDSHIPNPTSGPFVIQLSIAR